ncbi:7956_t:CDS:2, partial [Ambispora leptoticha]
AAKSEKKYHFLTLTTTREEAEEKVKQEEKLLKLINKPETESELEKLKLDLGKLEKFISQIDLVDVSTLNPVQHAYWKNKEATDSKREKLVEAINNLQRQSLISKIEVAVQKINASLEGQGVKLIEDESTNSLEKLCQIEPKIEYREIGIETNIQRYFFIGNYELDELAAKGSEIARRINDIR